MFVGLGHGCQQRHTPFINRRRRRQGLVIRSCSFRGSLHLRFFLGESPFGPGHIVVRPTTKHDAAADGEAGISIVGVDKKKKCDISSRGTSSLSWLPLGLSVIIILLLRIGCGRSPPGWMPHNIDKINEIANKCEVDTCEISPTTGKRREEQAAITTTLFGLKKSRRLRLVNFY